MAKKQKSQTAPVRAMRNPNSAFSDPVVKLLSAAIALMTVGFLLTVVFALINGTIDLGGTVKTMEDNFIVKADTLIATGRGAEGYQAKLEAQLAAKRLDAAEATLKLALTKKLDITQGDNINYMKAALAMYKGEYQAAIDLYKQVVVNTRAAYEAEYNKKTTEKNWAKAFGINPNNERAILGMAQGYIELKKWTEALDQLNVYLKINKSDFGVIADRGEVYYQLGDMKKARADFEKSALALPEDPVVMAGLKKTAEDK